MKYQNMMCLEVQCSVTEINGLPAVHGSDLQQVRLGGLFRCVAPIINNDLRYRLRGLNRRLRNAVCVVHDTILRVLCASAC